MNGIDAYNPRYSTLKKMQRSGKNASTILQDNRNLILQLIYENGNISRKQLSDMTGLQLATITIIIKELLSQELIRESGKIDGGSGRQVKTFSIIEGLYVIAVRLTSVYIKVAAYDIKMTNKYVKKVFFKTDDVIFESIEIIKNSIAEIEALLDKSHILGIAIGVEHKYRLINDDYSIWDNKRGEYCSIGKLIHDQTNYLVFTNRAINYSSYYLNKNIKDIIQVATFHVLININISYELESAIIIDDEIIYGKNGRCGQMKDVNVDHTLKKTYKDVIPVPAILNRVEEIRKEFPESCIASIQDLNIRDVISGYNRNDALCRKVYNEICYHLGYCIAEQIKWLDPDAVVVGDEIPYSKDFLDCLRKYVAEFSDENLAQRVHCIMLERVTEKDPALIGAVSYMFNKVIGEIGLICGM